MRTKLATQIENWWEYKEPTISPRTVVSYQAALQHLPADFTAKRLHRVKPRDVQALLLSLPTPTARKVRQVLNQVFDDAILNEQCERNPVALINPHLPSKAPRRAVEPREVDSLISVAQPQYKALISAAAYAGLRLGEALALKPSDIHLETETISITKQWNYVTKEFTKPKTKAGTRDVVYATKIGGLLKDHLSQYSTDSLVFTNSKGNPLHASNFRNRVWKPLTDYHFHDLRHTYASILIRSGVNLALVARLMGHSNPQITLRIYADYFQDDYTEARKALDAY